MPVSALALVSTLALPLVSALASTLASVFALVFDLLLLFLDFAFFSAFGVSDLAVAPAFASP